VTVAERTLRADTGRDDFVAVRLAADFVRPVPLAEIDLAATVLRAARSAALVETRLSAAGRDCLLGRVWFVRATDTTDLTNQATGSSDPAPIPAAATGLGYTFGYGDSLDWRFRTGQFGVPGPAAAWVRPTMTLFDDQPYSGLARAALIADSGSGISAELDWATWSFLNVDLDVHLARPVCGEWLLLDAATQLGAAGSALASSTLSDERGPVGAGLQTLVVAPRGPQQPQADLRA
jgi:hypothetical protein